MQSALKRLAMPMFAALVMLGACVTPVRAAAIPQHARAKSKERARSSSVPARPTALRARVRSGTVTLTWSDRSAAGSSYQVYRVRGDRRWGSPYARRVTSRRFVDRHVAAGGTYRYRVRAVNRRRVHSRPSVSVRAILASAAAVPGDRAPANQGVPTAPAAPPSPDAPWSPPAATPPALPAPSRFLSASGTDSGACGSAPCRTLNYAYRQAKPGEVVEMAAGSYGSQSIAVDTTKTASADVVFVPAPGAAVSAGEVTVTGKHVELREIATTGWTVKSPADDVTFRDVTNRGALFITSASNVSVIGGSVGPADSYDSQIKASDTTGAPVPTNILIDGVDFHDFSRIGDPSAHVECLQFGAGVNVTIRNSIFRRCATQGLFLRSWGGTAKISNVLIENNWFDATIEGYYALNVSQMVGQTYDNVIVRYNSSLQPLLVDANAATGVSFVANVAPRASHQCFGNQHFAYNVWSGTTCDATDKNAPAGFVNAGALDLHLAAGSAAVNAGDPTSHPAADIDGQARSGVPDAGADER